MQFKTEYIETFRKLFNERKERIRNFEGCLHLELWEEANHPDIFFTYSHWESEDALNHYRFSPFFKETWALTKALFADKPQAWSIDKRMVVD